MSIEQEIWEQAVMGIPPRVGCPMHRSIRDVVLEGLGT